MGKRKRKKENKPPAPPPISPAAKLVGAGAVLAVGVLVFAIAGRHESRRTATEQESSAGAHPAAAPPTREAIPSFHQDPDEARPFPPILPASRFPIPFVARAYEMAARMPEVLAQQPCYCNCDRIYGHGSLLDCYATEHGAG